VSNVSAAGKSLVLVAGSGRSGTSLFAGLLQRLGLHVPQPEVEPDISNPRGFAESQWIVDFHERLLTSAVVQTADARPAAWASTASVAARERNLLGLRAFLEEQFAVAEHLVIKDPRLAWFLPLWRRCAEDLGVTPSVVTMLRHPAAVVDSKSRYYGVGNVVVGRTAGWVNGMAFTERATRDMRRVFVRYDDLLTDWPVVVARVGEKLSLDPVNAAGAPALRRANELVDPSLRRSAATWRDDMGIPTPLREQADELWQLLDTIADKDDADTADSLAALDAVRQRYVAYYEEAESIAQSSVWNARESALPRPESLRWRHRLVRLVPGGLRQRVPVRWRRKVLRRKRAAERKVANAKT
jgi:hypothetical protein